LGQILAGSLLEANFCHLAAPRPAIEFLFWDHWETAILGQILAGSFLEPDFGSLAAPGPAIKLLSLGMSRNPRFGPNPGRKPFGARFWEFVWSGAGSAPADPPRSAGGFD